MMCSAIPGNSEIVSSANGTDDREAYPKRWVALYTKPRSEKKAAKAIHDLKTEIYIPLQVQIHQWSDRKKKVEVPVIPMVIFAKVDPEELSLIKHNPLIIKVLSRPGEKTPAFIPDTQIEQLKFILGQTDVPVEFDSRPFRVDDTVEVVRGYFRGLKGEIHECSDGTTDFIVRIDVLGGAKLKINKQDLVHIN